MNRTARAARYPSRVLTVQDALLTLQQFWTDRGCLVTQPFNTEVGAGTMNPATILRVLGPEPWHVAYVEPSVRPDDARYGQNPNRLQQHTQFQVILKPDPGNPQELYLDSLRALGIDVDAHDVRFVEDNWAQPAIGAWGLGWEVWLDGLEITQFTYFQQVGGQNLDPVSVEITYGVERIMMALQGVTHFKDMVYAEGVSYGEIFAQGEYEMSRYYLDDADVATNQELFARYIGEAERMIEARLPVPAHTYVLKSSHAFNVLDSRGAISTTERAQAFSTMRRLAREVSALWVARREELGFPLLDGAAPGLRNDSVMPPAAGEPMDGDELASRSEALRGAAPELLAIEIGVEELPPHVLDQAIEQVREGLTSRLAASRLEHGPIVVAGTPRRIVARVAAVASYEPDADELRKGPKVSAAYDADGNPTKPALGFARGQGVEAEELERADFGGTEHVVVRRSRPGRSVLEVVADALGEIVTGLRADKNMRWGDPELSYSRPIRWLVALWGGEVVPTHASGVHSGRTTYLGRTDAAPLVRIETAADLERVLTGRGFVLEPERRRAIVLEQATALAAGVGGLIDAGAEAGLLDEITNLVEAPHGILGEYEARYLELPEEILTTVMRKHQRYLPVRSVDGALLPYFVAIANGECDEDAVRVGNENVLRARYEDAAFFYDADREVAPEVFRGRLERLTFENRLGSVAARADRIRDGAANLATVLDGLDAPLSEADQRTLVEAGRLAKFDLATQMVVELSSLAGVMARDYALKAGQSPEVATALFEMELPRSAGDALPTSVPGALLSLADRFDLLVAMFAIGAKPTGSSDPFALRRAALGVVSVLRMHPALEELGIEFGVGIAAARLEEQGIEVSPEARAAVVEFVTGRFEQQLRDEGVSAEHVAVITPMTNEPFRAQAVLDQLPAARAVEGFGGLVEQVQRITRIVPQGTEGAFDRSVLTDAAELALADAVADLTDFSRAPLPEWARASVDSVGLLTRFFDEVLVMAEDDALKAARLGLLQTIVDRAPSGIDWRALDHALDG
nr:glycine--tRNA ligase [Pseudactinotalea sp. HY158]